MDTDIKHSLAESWYIILCQRGGNRLDVAGDGQTS